MILTFKQTYSFYRCINPRFNEIWTVLDVQLHLDCTELRLGAAGFRNTWTPLLLHLGLTTLGLHRIYVPLYPDYIIPRSRDTWTEEHLFPGLPETQAQRSRRN